jgi:hypothetical protein
MENLDFPFNYWGSKGSHRLLALDAFVKDFETRNSIAPSSSPQSHNSIFSFLQEVIPRRKYNVIIKIIGRRMKNGINEAGYIQSINIEIS